MKTGTLTIASDMTVKVYESTASDLQTPVFLHSPLAKKKKNKLPSPESARLLHILKCHSKTN